MQNSDKIIEDIATLKQQHLNLERFVGDRIKICTGEIKEHINQVSAKQRIDIQAGRDYCEAENKTIYEAVDNIKSRLDKVAYGTAGAITVLSIIAWAVSTFAK